MESSKLQQFLNRVTQLQQQLLKTQRQLGDTVKNCQALQQESHQKDKLIAQLQQRLVQSENLPTNRKNVLSQQKDTAIAKGDLAKSREARLQQQLDQHIEANRSLQEQIQQLESCILDLQEKGGKSQSSTTQGREAQHSPTESAISSRDNNQQQLLTLQKRLSIQTQAYEALQQDYQQQSSSLQCLEQKLADLQRLGAIAENQLNKWRYRTF